MEVLRARSLYDYIKILKEKNLLMHILGENLGNIQILQHHVIEIILMTQIDL